LPLNLNSEKKVARGFKELKFQRNLDISQVENYPEIFKVDLTYKWQEKNKTVQLMRSAYIAHFQDDPK